MGLLDLRVCQFCARYSIEMNRLWFFVLATAAIIGLSAATPVPYKACQGGGGSPMGVIHSVDVSDCAKSPCEVKRGSNYTVSVNFTIAESTDQAFADVHGIVAGVPVEFPLPQKNACESGSLSCPLQAKHGYLYTATLPILHAYPAISVIVEWALNDAQLGGNTIFCFEIPIRVVD